MDYDSSDQVIEWKIEEALRSGARSLNLGYSRIIELPKALGDLVHLQTLEIFANHLKLLPTRIGNLVQLQSLDVSDNQLEELPESLGKLINLQTLKVANNNLDEVPDSLEHLKKLHTLKLSGNHLSTLSEAFCNLTALVSLNVSFNKLENLPDTFYKLKNLKTLNLSNNNFATLPLELVELNNLQSLKFSNHKITKLPEWIGKLSRLQELDLSYNQLTDLPTSLTQLQYLEQLNLDENPLNLELAEAYKHGLNAVKGYLRAKAKSQTTLNEAKLIIIGEGAVGKTCLMDALLRKPWQEHPSTHGIEIQQIKVTDSETQKEITLNGWDFGGQRVYRPTHQLFFSAPAVYLVVWKPREGSQQGFVSEWIRLIKRRAPSARILIVATHGGPQQRQPDIDRQELWDLFGKETVVDFFFVNNKPDKHGNRTGIEDLKRAIARIAATLPEVGRTVPKSFADVRRALMARGVTYLPLDEVISICYAHKMDDEIARLFITISHRLGHLTYYENDPTLRDIVILRPDWLATAMSYVLDDEETRAAHGLVKFSRLSKLWDDPSRATQSRYPVTLHPIFLRLMERFDLSYRVADPSVENDNDPLSLIGQLVPDIRPLNLESAWLATPYSGDIQQTQICRIVDAQNGESATAEGLFYQLIVRLHKYSLGRVNYNDSVHWQRGLVLDNAYNGRAFLEHKGNDVHITVRAPYPERFLAMLTEEVKYLVESFWQGLRCDVTVPCLNPKPCVGLFEVAKLIENKRRGRPEQPCPICNEWQSIDWLLSNAPAATQPVSLDDLLKEFAHVKGTLNEVNDNTRRILSQVDKQYADLIQIFSDEAKEGPRLFSFFPLDRSNFNPKSWVRTQFRLVLWCEHSRLPLPMLNNGDMKKGVFDLEIEREWFTKAVPYLRLLTGTLSLVLPVASSTLKVIDDSAFKTLENQLTLGKDVINAVAGSGTALNEFMGKVDASNLELGVAVRGDGATLRELHSLLKVKDPSFGGLVRVMNKRQEFLWVHAKFASEY